MNPIRIVLIALALLVATAPSTHSQTYWSNYASCVSSLNLSTTCSGNTIRNSNLSGTTYSYLSVGGYYTANDVGGGQFVQLASCPNYYSTGTTAPTGTNTLTVSPASAANITVGMGVNSSTSGLLKNEAVAAVNTGTGVITLTQFISGSASSTTLYFGGNFGTIVMDDEASTTPTCFQRLGAPTNILQWGAVADASITASSTTGTDNDPFISAALAYLEPLGGATLYFPSGNGNAYGTQGHYDLTNHAGFNVVCAGSGITMIKAIGTSSATLFTFGYPSTAFGGSTPSVIGGGIQGCNINANGIANDGVDVKGLENGIFNDLAIENALLTNLDIEDGTGGYANGATLNNSFKGLSIDATFHTAWTTHIPNYTALGIDIDDNTATYGCFTPQVCAYDSNFVVQASLTTSSTISFSVGVNTAIGAVVTDQTNPTDIPTGTYVIGCSTSCTGTGQITLSNPISATAGDFIQFNTGHNYAVRQTDFQNCNITVNVKSAGIRVGYGNGDVFGCVIAQTLKGISNSATGNTNSGAGANTLTGFTAGSLNNIVVGSTVTDAHGYIPANAFVTACGSTPCSTATSLTISQNASMASSDTFTFDATNAMVTVATLPSGTPNWLGTTNPSGLSEPITLPNAIPDLWIGDAVSDSAGKIPAGDYVIGCNTAPNAGHCSSATTITLAQPITASTTNDTLTFSTNHYSVELQGAPIGLGTGLGGNGPAWHEFFYGTQTGPGTVRCENLFRAPESTSFPNSGICENDVFVVQNSDNSGFGTIAVDPGARMLMCHDTGDCIGDVHVGEIFLAGQPNYDSLWHSFSESLRSEFFNGADLPGITAVGDTANPALSLWDRTPVNNVTLGVDQNAGDLDVTTGVAQSSAVALIVENVMECASDQSYTPQYQQCATSTAGGNILVEVDSTAGLNKMQSVTITGVNGVQFGSNPATSASAACNADVTGPITVLDATHFYFPNISWTLTVSGNWTAPLW